MRQPEELSGRCATCKHWSECEPEEGTAARRGTCQSGKIRYIGFDEDEALMEVPPDGVGYEDQDVVAAYCWTGPEFGCIHWVKR